MFHAFGRWFTVWRSREEPEERRWTVLRVNPDSNGPLGLAFFEV